MDEIVLAALKKWPNVPACYGWLALDARGDWYMRDDRVQAAGAFPAVKGSRIEHELDSPLRGPAAFRVRGTLIALRKTQAFQVLVQPSNPQNS